MSVKRTRLRKRRKLKETDRTAGADLMESAGLQHPLSSVLSRRPRVGIFCGNCGVPGYSGWWVAVNRVPS
ncbi:hypothetical protein MHYP_G00336810 [Metynnis hypsauchen]